MTEQRDYRDTVFLPKTDFPMKAGLPAKEPGILARWQDEQVYARLRKAREGAEKFVLHDGPPYANGDIHIGHALNKVLKDAVVRTQTLLGKDAPYIPGWDCHGLPIEWKVEEAYRKKKLNKDEVPAEEFRAECRAYAAHWVQVQKAQFQRLGITGDWDRPYLTMAPEAEALIVAELLKFAESGQLYRGAKPVMWSPVEKTALAEAEVEYEDIVSTQIDVAFEIVESPIEELKGAYAVIWTTTPWTIPVNQALAYGSDIFYELIELQSGAFARDIVPSMTVPDIGTSPTWELVKGRKIVVAAPLRGQLFGRIEKAISAELGYEVSLASQMLKANAFKGSDLAGTIARHPMHHLGGFFAAPRPLLPGDFVTTESGTGLVHMAPDHGEDDFDLCKSAQSLGWKENINPVFSVQGDGRYREDWPWLGGQGSVINPKFNAPDGPICSDLREVGGLLAASTDYQHSYPHSWRSKAKVIFRCTPQWFVPMDKPVAPFDYPVAPLDAVGGAVALAVQADHTATLRETAMQAIADTAFYPDKGRNRIGSMVEDRPDWVLSRQRAWGVPITLFVDRKTGEYLVDPAVNARIVEAIRAHGVDGWSDEAAPALLGPDYNPDDYERIVDILDVWFDSGSTHAFVLESGTWPELQSPADLYLEGSDQHRGWFQSSLLESCATRGRAPYKAVLTHGFTMDAKGMKMSKSLGNTVNPLTVMEEYGADIIRLWALSVDYTADHRIGPEILKGVADQYRKLRNTFRYLLGALDGYTEAEAVGVEQMPELERYMLALLGDLDARMKAAVEAYDFNTYTRALVDFCNEDLSAFFFDIRKDALYCDHPADLRRRAYRTVLDTMFQALIRYAAPVLVFTAEEVWRTRYPDGDSVHLAVWPVVPLVEDEELLSKLDTLRHLRLYSNLTLEKLRAEKVIRSSLEAKSVFHVRTDLHLSKPDVNELAELCIISEAEIIYYTGAEKDRSIGEVPVSADATVSGSFASAGVLVTHERTTHHKCGRCWRHLPEVTENGDLCDRCDDVVTRLDAEASATA